MEINLGLTEQLLKSSLICGLKPGEKTVHRFKLFFVANKELNSKSHESDFQKVLENGVTKDKYWENWGEKTSGKKGSGEYRITKGGYKKAKELFPEINPRDFPNSFSLEGSIGEMKFLIKTHDNKRKIFLNDKPCKGTRVCECLGIPEEKMEKDSAIRILYDFAIDNNFKLSWEL